MKKVIYPHNYSITASLKKQEERGGRFAITSHKIDIEKRRNGGKILKVTTRPDGNSYSPSIRVQGKWLTDFGFNLEDKVKLQVKNNQIIISHI